MLSRLVIGVALALSGRQPRRLLGLVLVAGVTVAIVQAVHQQHWAVAFVLAAVAAVSGRSEFAADRFAARRGLGPASG